MRNKFPDKLWKNLKLSTPRHFCRWGGQGAHTRKKKNLNIFAAGGTLVPAQEKNNNLGSQETRKYLCSPVQLCCIPLLSAKCLVEDCLSKKIFVGDWAQSPSDMNFWTFSVTSRHFSDHNNNIQQFNCAKMLNLIVFCKHFSKFLL